jgi:hypothetical protein
MNVIDVTPTPSTVRNQRWKVIAKHSSKTAQARARTIQPMFSAGFS